MARLDVSWVLRSAQFADTIDVIRNLETIDVHGRAQFAPSTIPNVSAVVTQHNGDIMRRQQAGTHVEGTISVYTKFRLTDGKDLDNKELAADLVVYPSGSQNRYTVSKVNDYSRWGGGWVSAVCELLPMEPPS